MDRFPGGGADYAVQADFLFGRCGVTAGADRGEGAAPTGPVGGPPSGRWGGCQVPHPGVIAAGAPLLRGRL